MDILVTIPDSDLREVLFPPERRNRLESLGTVDWNSKSEQFTPGELRNRLPGIDICVTGWESPQLDETVLRDADELELVTHVGGSVALIGSHALYDEGITVCSANAILAKYVAEGILGYALAGLRKIPTFDANLKAGGWREGTEKIQSLYDATVGFIGLGDVGRHLLELLEPFNVEVLLYDPYVSNAEVDNYDNVEQADLESVLRAADVTSIHAPKTPETIHMIDADRLSHLPDDSLLINAARGEIIDQDALVDELQTGRISAVLDVYREEPLPEDSPLRTLENVGLLPHVSGYPSRYHMPEIILDEIERFVDDRPLKHTISRERFKRMTNDRLGVEDKK